MNVKNRIGLRRADVRILCIVLALAALLFWIDASPKSALDAVIYMDGTIVRRIALDKVKDSYTFRVGGCTLLVRHGGIAFAEADCADGLCVRRGELTHAGDCMACVPNRVVVMLTGRGAADAVTG